MAYDPPTLAEFRARVARDLRDEGQDAFSTAEIDDYINDGMAELNEIAPLETFLVITDPADFHDLGLTYLWRVEAFLIAGNTGQNIIPPNNDETNYPNGWQYYGDTLFLPKALYNYYLPYMTSGDIQIRLYGYRNRSPMTDDTQVCEFSRDWEEQGVRQYCRWRGLQALQNDRNLFQQWQTAANNSDVSPTQLNNMEQVSESEFTRTRRRLFQIRRPAVGF